MKSLKVEIEKYIQANWTQTPVKFQGSTFAQTSEWVSVVFIPLDRSLYAFDGGDGRKKDTVMLKVLSYSDNPTKCLGLEDDVRAFLECINIPNNNARVGMGKPDGLGVIDLENGVFEASSTYLIESYN